MTTNNTASTTLLPGEYLGLLNNGTITAISRVEGEMLVRVRGASVTGVTAPVVYGPGDRGFQLDDEPLMVWFTVSAGLVTSVRAN